MKKSKRRRRAESNRRVKILQIFALPLGHYADSKTDFEILAFLCRTRKPNL